MKNVILIGMPASGKSTVGVVLAKQLGFDFIDPDLLIQKKYQKKLAQIISEQGNDGFLAIENQVNTDLCVENSVIAPGGSVVYCEEAMAHYKESGVVVYLHISYDKLYQRLTDTKNRGVVLKEGQSLQNLYDERRVLFEKYADITIVQDDKKLAETIEAIVACIENYNS